MPDGAPGLRESLPAGSVPDMLKHIVEDPSVILVTFLGAYFYTLMVSIRRWTRADLTTGVLWKINIRLLVALLVGFLLAAMTLEEADVSSIILLTIGFLGGIVPDTVLAWLSQQARRVINPKVEKIGGIFSPSDLQEKIEGLNFWQADRLFEEGIESILDLAVKEIPDLLINTRFATPQILCWVDRALLSNQPGEQAYLFHDAFINTASSLALLAGENQKDMAQVLKAIQDGQQSIANGQSAEVSGNGSYIMTLPLLENIVEGLRHGPNLPYARAYWANTSSPERQAERLAQLDQVIISEL